MRGFGKNKKRDMSKFTLHGSWSTMSAPSKSGLGATSAELVD